MVMLLFHISVMILFANFSSSRLSLNHQPSRNQKDQAELFGPGITKRETVFDFFFCLVFSFFFHVYVK